MELEVSIRLSFIFHALAGLDEGCWDASDHLRCTTTMDGAGSPDT